MVSSLDEHAKSAEVGNRGRVRHLDNDADVVESLHLKMFYAVEFQNRYAEDAEMEGMVSVVQKRIEVGWNKGKPQWNSSRHQYSRNIGVEVEVSSALSGQDNGRSVEMAPE